MGKIPNTVMERIRHLLSSRNDHLELYERMLSADCGRLFGPDFVAQATLHRSLSLINGFVLMVKNRNFMCALPLLRLQVDSLIRLYSLTLVDDTNPVVSALFKGTPLRKVKSRNGERMTDAYLHQQASKLWPWVSKVYQWASQFVHFSAPIVTAPVERIDESSGAFLTCVGNGGREWREDEMLEALNIFDAATRALLGLIKSWIEKKESVAKIRETCPREDNYGTKTIT